MIIIRKIFGKYDITNWSWKSTTYFLFVEESEKKLIAYRFHDETHKYNSKTGNFIKSSSGALRKGPRNCHNKSNTFDLMKMNFFYFWVIDIGRNVMIPVSYVRFAHCPSFNISSFFMQYPCCVARYLCIPRFLAICGHIFVYSRLSFLLKYVDYIFIHWHVCFLM